VLDDNNAGMSHLVFDKAMELHAQSIQHLDINSHLVVLSACETAQGQFVSGEGVISLGRAFMYAGASSTVNTLWKIRDKSSASIMKLFYEKLLAGQTKGAALQASKQAYLEQEAGPQSAHPYFWAAYTMVGDVEAITEGENTWMYWMIGGVIGFVVIILGLSKRRKE